MWLVVRLSIRAESSVGIGASGRDSGRAKARDGARVKGSDSAKVRGRDRGSNRVKVRVGQDWGRDKRRSE